MNDIIFFNVDTQKDFMESNGALYAKDAELIKPQLKFLTEYAEMHNIKVINTADYHTDRSIEISETPDFKSTFPKHCMVATEGGDFISETDPKKFFEDNYYIVRYTDSKIEEEKFNRARNIIILKDAFDVFLGNPLTDEVLNLLKPKEIFVYGVSGDYCVDYAVGGLIKRKHRVIVIEDAIKSIGETPFSKWLENGVKSIFTNDVNDFIKDEK
jgi:nicotinamidase/pyrazinamidase